MREREYSRCKGRSGSSLSPGINGGIMQTVNQLLRAKGGQVFSVAPEDSVLHAIEVMATRHVGALLVMEQDSLLGIISERDYARKVILKNRSSHDTPVRDIMTAPAVSVTPDDTVHHCMEIMTERRFRHLPVIKSGRVVGMLSIGDLVKAVIQEQTERIEQLEHYIAG
jgi:CBS domain-containing protein